jgi:hypothetical protein
MNESSLLPLDCSRQSSWSDLAAAARVLVRSSSRIAAYIICCADEPVQEFGGPFCSQLRGRITERFGERPRKRGPQKTAVKMDDDLIR